MYPFLKCVGDEVGDMWLVSKLEQARAANGLD